MKLDSTKLKKFRAKYQLSQVEFADSLGISQATVCEWERKDTDIKITYYDKLVAIYGTDINDLINNANTINIPNNNLSLNLDQYNPLVGYEITLENNMPSELVITLKQQNENLQKHIERQNKLIDNFNLHLTFLEDIIVWFKNKT